MSLSDESFLYLIGVNHAVQFKSAVAQMFGESESVRQKREAFTAHVAEMIAKLDIEILAEEFSEQGKLRPDVREEEACREKLTAELGTAPELVNYETVLEEFSKAKGIEHRFCDPDAEERKALGIENPIGVNENKSGCRESRTANAGACCSCAGTITTTPSRYYWRVMVSMCGVARTTISVIKSFAKRQATRLRRTSTTAISKGGEFFLHHVVTTAS